MIYLHYANATALAHLLTIIGVLAGLLWSFRHKRFRPFEAALLIIVVILWSYYGNCPFTILEQHYRDLAGDPANLTSVGFLPYYANKLFGISLASKFVQQSTFFTGGIFFAASIDWFSPYINFEIFKFRKAVRRMFGKTAPKRARA